jgi:hypothetical protein
MQYGRHGSSTVTHRAIGKAHDRMQGGSWQPRFRKQVQCGFVASLPVSMTVATPPLANIATAADPAGPAPITAASICSTVSISRHC